MQEVKGDPEISETAWKLRWCCVREEAKLICWNQTEPQGLSRPTMLPMHFKKDLLHHHTCPTHTAINKDWSALLEFCTEQPVLCWGTSALRGTYKRCPQVYNMSQRTVHTVTFFRAHFVICIYTNASVYSQTPSPFSTINFMKPNLFPHLKILKG